MTPDQHRCAALIASGWTYRQVADELGVHRATVSNWAQQPEVRRELERHRRERLDQEPSADSVLRAALNATTVRGHPDWAARLKAAGLLLGHAPDGATPEEKVREVRIYVGEHE